MGRESEETFSKEDIHMTNIINEKISRIINLQGNANQNHNGKSPWICEKGCHQKEHMLVMMWRERKGTLLTLLVGM